MKHIRSADCDEAPIARDKVIERTEESHTPYTPADFFREFSAVIAVCLGLALLAQVLVTVVLES